MRYKLNYVSEIIIFIDVNWITRAFCRIDVTENGPQWYQYFLCGVKGIITLLPKNTPIKGFNVIVSGSIPQSAGLSSSSALVSAAALATAHANNVSL